MRSKLKKLEPTYNKGQDKVGARKKILFEEVQELIEMLSDEVHTATVFQVLHGEPNKEGLYPDCYTKAVKPNLKIRKALVECLKILK